MQEPETHNDDYSAVPFAILAESKALPDEAGPMSRKLSNVMPKKSSRSTARLFLQDNNK